MHEPPPEPGEPGHPAAARVWNYVTIPLPNPFEVEVRNQPLSFTARKDAEGNVTGHFTYHQVVEDESFDFDVEAMTATGPRSVA